MTCEKDVLEKHVSGQTKTCAVLTFLAIRFIALISVTHELPLISHFLRSLRLDTPFHCASIVFYFDAKVS